MKRRAFVAMGVAGLAGCGLRGKGTIGVVPKGATQLFWRTAHAGTLKAAQEFGLDIYWNAPASESDRSRQIAIVDSMINRGVEGIALAPIDRAALVGVVERAIDRGIPVTIFDSALDSKRILSYVATDNQEGGRVAARRIGSLLSGRGKVAIIDDQPGSASTTARVNGFQEECARQFPNLQLLPPQFGWADRAKARAVMENLLTAHQDLAGVFANHENAAAGAALALSARGAKGLRLVAFDTSDQLLTYLKDGWIDSLIVQNPFRMGYEAVRTLAFKINGKTVEKQIDTGSTLVTVADLDKPEIKELLNPDLGRWIGPR